MRKRKGLFYEIMLKIFTFQNGIGKALQIEINHMMHSYHMFKAINNIGKETLDNEDILITYVANGNKKNVKIQLILNNSFIDFNNSFILLLCCCQYTNFKLRFTFAEYPSELKYSYRIYLCQNEMRNHIMSLDLYSSGISYKNGSAFIKKHE